MNESTVFFLLLAVITLGVAVIALGLESLRVRREIRELSCELERRTQYVPLFDATPLAVCRGCGGDELVIIMAGCTWVEDNLCSSCADDEECDARAAGERS